MNTITRFDKVTCRDLVDSVRSAVDTIADNFGIQINLKYKTLEDHRLTLTIECCIICKDGEANTIEAEDFRRHATSRYSLKASDLHSCFKFPGRREMFKIIGLRVRATRYPILIQSESTRRIAACSAEAVKLGLRTNAARGKD